MPYVERDGTLKVIGLYGSPQPGKAEELLRETDPEVVAFYIDADKASKAREINLAFQDAVLRGIQSSALGTPHHYPMNGGKQNVEGQLDLVAAAAANVDVVYTCTEVATRTEARRLHTAAQMRQVMLDGLALKQTYIGKKSGLFAQIRAVDSTGKTYDQAKAELDAIVW